MLFCAPFRSFLFLIGGNVRDILSVQLAVQAGPGRGDGEVGRRGDRGRGDRGASSQVSCSFLHVSFSPRHPISLSLHLPVSLSFRFLTLIFPSAIKTVLRPLHSFSMQGRLFRSSSMVEHSAVNRRVASSSLACGARLDEGRWNYSSGLFVWQRGVVNSLVATKGNGGVPGSYGQFATSRLDESRLLAIREVSDVLRCPRLVWVFAFIGVENKFSPFRRGVEARVAHSNAPARS